LQPYVLTRSNTHTMDSDGRGFGDFKKLVSDKRL
jgi:hypothetical protein